MVQQTELLLPRVQTGSHAMNTKDKRETHSRQARASLNASMKGVPAFLRSLYHIVNEENYDLIHWSEDGDSFLIKEHDRFAKEVLGEWFKHTNYSSFVRQLNNYGFHKILHLQQGALRSNGAHEYHHYIHSDFRRNRQDLLTRIQRKGQSASDDSTKSPEVHNPMSVKKEDLTMVTEAAPPDDFSRSRLFDAILLEVEGLKHRQGEQERESQLLRDRVDVLETNVARQQDMILRLLACLGLIPIVDYNRATRGQSQLMIENNVPGKTEIGEEAVISSPLSSPQSSVSTICGGGDSDDTTASQQNSPISTDGPSSPPPSPSASGVTQSTGHLGLIFGENTRALVNCGSSAPAPDFSGYLTDYPVIPLPSDHIYSESFPISLDNSKSIDSSGESIFDYDHSYGMDDIHSGIFHDFLSSHTSGSSSDGSTIAGDPSFELDATSSMQVTTDLPPPSSAQGNSTHSTASAKGIKRKVDLMHEPCAHAPVPTLSLHDTQPPPDFVHPTSLLTLKGQLIAETTPSTQPRASNSNFNFNSSTIFFPSGDESEIRPPKRAKSTLASKAR